MRVQVVDPPAYTPPYDHALCAALARAGAEVELLTTRFAHGPAPRADGYVVDEIFYPRASRLDPGPLARRALRAAEHPGGMRRLRARAASADVVHFQWLALPTLDRFWLPPRPRVLTVHDPPADSGRRRRAERALFERMDALVAHSEAGAARLRELGADPARVHRIPHGVFDHLPRQPAQRPLPAELAEVEGPVVLCFGLIRPYKGIDVLLEAFRELEGAELWIVGMPRMDLGPLERLAARCRSRVRFVPRFVTEVEIPAFFERADLVVLPYRRIEQSGVLYTALAFGSAIVASSVGGFTEVGERDGALALVPAGDPAALGAELERLLADAGARAQLAAAAARAAAGPYSWDAVAERTLALYRELGADNPPR